MSDNSGQIRVKAPFRIEQLYAHEVACRLGLIIADSPRYDVERVMPFAVEANREFLEKGDERLQPFRITSRVNLYKICRFGALRRSRVCLRRGTPV